MPLPALHLQVGTGLNPSPIVRFRNLNSQERVIGRPNISVIKENNSIELYVFCLGEFVYPILESLAFGRSFGFEKELPKQSAWI